MKHLRFILMVLLLVAIACGTDTTESSEPTQEVAAATSTNEPTVTEVPTDTPTSTSTPEPTQTSTATSTPEPTATRRPTATRLPTSTPRPTATATPLPEPVTYSGSGDDVVEIEWPAGNIAIMTITYTGGRNFSIWTLDSSGDKIDLEVNHIGGYSGTRPFNFFEEPAFIEVGASGSWEIVIKPLGDANRVLAFPFDGLGDDVVIIESGLQSGRVTISHSGARNFAVWAFDSSGARDLLVNEVGSYTGTVLFRDYFLLDVKADGAWTMDAAD